MAVIEQVKISFAKPAADRLNEVRQRMIATKGRHVTYTETLELLLDTAAQWENQ